MRTTQRFLLALLAFFCCGLSTAVAEAAPEFTITESETLLASSPEAYNSLEAQDSPATDEEPLIPIPEDLIDSLSESESFISSLEKRPRAMLVVPGFIRRILVSTRWYVIGHLSRRKMTIPFDIEGRGRHYSDFRAKCDPDEYGIADKLPQHRKKVFPRKNYVVGFEPVSQPPAKRHPLDGFW